MRYPFSPHLAAAISLAFALPANAQETRAPIDEAAAIDAKEGSVFPPRDTPSATQIEPRTDDRQSLGRGIYNVGPISLEGLGELSVVDFVDTLEGSGFKVENPNATGACGCGSSFTV